MRQWQFKPQGGAMEFQEVVRRRRMVRNFEDRPIPPETLDRILENALHAPSAGFSQGWAFLVLDGQEQTRRYWDALDAGRGWERSGWPGVYNAPVLIVPLANKQAYLARYSEADKAAANRRTEEDWETPYWYVDTGFASLLMLLTAVDEGLGAVFFGVTNHAAFHAALNVPVSYHPIGVIALGYPAPDHLSGSLKRGRRPQAEVVHRGQW
jgi:nitroreductase